MRKALIGLLIATTAASPLAAQDNGWRGRGEGEHHQRSEGQRPARQDRQAAPQQQQAPRAEQNRGGGWQGRQQAQVQQQQQQVQVQQQAQARGYRQGYQGGYAQQNGYRQQSVGNAGVTAQRYRGGNGYQGEGGYEAQRSYQGNRGYEGQRGYEGTRGDRNGPAVQWNRGWRNDNRYDWQRYRYSNRSLFRSPYYAPYGDGYGYNRLSIGGLLDEVFWGRNYWISDPWQYRLPPAPYGTQWVRYYNDVVLIDVYTGEVVDVIYDFFW